METNNGKQGFMILTGGLAAAAIIIVDAVFASEAPLAMSKCLLMTAVFAVLALIKFKDKEKLKASLAVSGIFLSAGLIAYGLPHLNNATAQSAAGEIIKAAENYKAKNGSYPRKLEELKPEFLAKIPKAKYTVLWSDFYLLDGNLVYVNTPPFNLMKYDFAGDKWNWGGSETFARILSAGGN